MNKQKVAGLTVLVALAVSAGVVFGGTIFDRLAPLVYVGRGSAVTESVAFDQGNGSGNGVVEQTASGVLQLANDGVNFVQVNAGKLRVPNGTASTPSFSFTSDTSSGIYDPGTGSVGISAGGSVGLVVSPSTIGLDQPTIAASGLTVNSSFLVANSGFKAFGGTESDGGGSAASQAYRVAIFTGTLVSQGGSIVLSAPAGVILSVTGWGQCDATSTWKPIFTGVGPYVNCDTYIPASNSTSVTIENQDSNAGNPNSGYRIIMIYQ